MKTSRPMQLSPRSRLALAACALSSALACAGLQYKPVHATPEGARVQIFEHRDAWSGCVAKGEVEGRSLVPDINETRAQMQNDAARMGANVVVIHSIMEAYGSGSAYACPLEAAPAAPESAPVPAKS